MPRTGPSACSIYPGCRAITRPRPGSPPVRCACVLPDRLRPPFAAGNLAAFGCAGVTSFASFAGEMAVSSSWYLLGGSVCCREALPPSCGYGRSRAIGTCGSRCNSCTGLCPGLCHTIPLASVQCFGAVGGCGDCALPPCGPRRPPHGWPAPIIHQHHGACSWPPYDGSSRVAWAGAPPPSMRGRIHSGLCDAAEASEELEAAAPRRCRPPRGFSAPTNIMGRVAGRQTAAGRAWPGLGRRPRPRGTGFTAASATPRRHLMGSKTTQ